MPDQGNIAVEIRSQTSAVVVSVEVAAGTVVRKGSLLLVTELMKMRQEFRAPFSATVSAISVTEGDVVEPATLLATLVRMPEQAEEPIEGGMASSADRPSFAEFRRLHDAVGDEARPDAVGRRHAAGMRTARENVADLADPGSFVEYGALAVAARTRKVPLDELRTKTPADGIIAGFATVNADSVGADNASCAILAVDYTVMAGTQGWYHHRKIDRILGIVEQNPVPLVVFPEGGGGRPNDVDAADVAFAGLDVPSFRSFARLAGKVPRIAVVEGRCFAGSAAFAGCADIVIATRRSNIGMGGPAMIEGGGLGVHPPEAIGPAEAQWSNGLIDILVEDEAEGVAAAKRVLSILQGPVSAPGETSSHALRDAVPEDRQLAYDVREVAATLADPGSFIELKAGFGAGMITAMLRIAGRPCGLLANNPFHLGGAIDPDGADKAARFLRLCDAFGLPLVSLIDTPGFMVGPDVETRGQVRRAGDLFDAGAALSVPVFAIILRKGYGLGAMAMAGGGFHAPVFTAAWPTAEIGAMGLEGAVRLGAKAELESVPEGDQREALFRKLVARAYDKGKAVNAARMLEFDAVIDPADTRRWIRAGLELAGAAGS